MPATDSEFFPKTGIETFKGQFEDLRHIHIAGLGS